MKRVKSRWRWMSVALCLGMAWGAQAEGIPGSCESEASWVRSDDAARHFMVLAASTGVFHNRSGPSFVMLMKTDAADATEMGAVGIYADEQGRAVFGAVPWQTYDAFLREPGKKSQSILLRLAINPSQYQRVLGVLRSWERRALKSELLYPDDVYMNNILLVKQATEELNRCTQTVDLYNLDWGVEDRISDENPSSWVPYLVFEELKRRNSSLHVSDGDLPAGLLRLAGSEPLQAQEPPPGQAVFVPPPPASDHSHHAHHMDEPAPAEH